MVAGSSGKLKCAESTRTFAMAAHQAAHRATMHMPADGKYAPYSRFARSTAVTGNRALRALIAVLAAKLGLPSTTPEQSVSVMEAARIEGRRGSTELKQAFG